MKSCLHVFNISTIPEAASGNKREANTIPFITGKDCLKRLYENVNDGNGNYKLQASYKYEYKKIKPNSYRRRRIKEKAAAPMITKK